VYIYAVRARSFYSALLPAISKSIAFSLLWRGARFSLTATLAHL
jgi:hypothetical protein